MNRAMMESQMNRAMMGVTDEASDDGVTDEASDDEQMGNVEFQTVKTTEAGVVLVRLKFIHAF